MNQFKSDYYRMTGKKFQILSIFELLYRYDLRFLFFFRQKKNLFKRVYMIGASRKYGLEILSDNIGEGLYLGHAHNINVNTNSIIGKNCNLSKGCTIGGENRGKRKGAPVLEDCVWVGTNAVVVGKIHIGNNVMIAPNAFVNFDVPDDSVVIGNPAIIKHNENATIDYIKNIV